VGKPGRIVSVGECMVELSRGPDGRFGLAYGGDTFNTAVYLARAGLDVAYATALGDDPYSAGILACAEREGIAVELIQTCPGRMPGLYVIETSASGERTFWYWRDRAPARELFEIADADRIAGALTSARIAYFSGVTLSLYSDRGLDRFARALADAKAGGTRVAMDSNYRPRGWAGDIGRARQVFGRFWALADLAMPTFDDEQALWGDAAPAAVIDRLAALGVGEIVVKNGPSGASLLADGEPLQAPCPRVVDALDTTAAGDSFNAGYLAARCNGASPDEAARHGHALAAIVIRHRGAIVPSEATAAVLKR
jgi:2-dehydro-3-deoxygluconokinase